MQNTTRIVADVNTLISAFLWQGTPWELLVLAQDNQIKLYTSTDLLAEFEEVLQRPHFSARILATGYTSKKILDYYQQLAISVETSSLQHNVCRDPDDDAVLACAIAAKAHIIVSGGKDLLVLHSFRDISIMSAANLIKQFAK